MPKTALLFAGQGAQQVGMGVDLAMADPAVADLYEDAKGACGIDAYSLSLLGPKEELDSTQNAQVCLLTAQVAYARAALKAGLTFDAVAGYGCGEYAAHVLAETVDFETAAQLVARRSALMALAAAQNKGAAARFEGMDHKQASELCSMLSKEGVTLAVAAYDAPGRVVLAGCASAVEEACIQWTSAGNECKELPGVGAVNTPLMQMAATNGVRPALNAILFGVGEVPIINNLDAQPFVARDVVNTLSEEITHPILWEQTVRALLDAGVTRFVQCGPGKDLFLSTKRTVEDAGVDAECIVIASAKDVVANF